MTEHRPVMVERIAELLVQDPDGIYMDATFGRGGHSRAILSRLSEKGRLIALDRDPEAIAFAQTLNEPRLIIEHTPFSNLSSVLKNLGIAHVHGIVLI